MGARVSLYPNLNDVKLRIGATELYCMIDPRHISAGPAQFIKLIYVDD